MGLFDFLFENKKKKERECQEQLRLQQEAEAKRHAEEQQRQAEARCLAEEQRQQEEARNRELEKSRQNNTKKAYLAIFSADWCGPSKRFLKEIQEAGINNYTLIDVDKDNSLATKYSIRSVPTTLLLDNDGNVIKKWVGYDDQDPGQTKFVSYIKNCSFVVRPFAESSLADVNQKVMSKTEEIVGTDDKPATEEIKKPNTNVLPTNETVSEHLQYLASQANGSFNTGNEQATIKFMNELFNACYGRNGYKLLQISDESTQVVGLAFTGIARYLEFNDPDLNSVAAENAFYCLARNLIAKRNTFCTPAIFTLLLNHSDLLRDKLIAAHCEIAQEDVGMPIGLMLGGNPFNSPHLKDFREQAVSKRIPIMAYILPFFYNEANKKYSIPTNMPYHIPSQPDIDKFIRMKSEYEKTTDDLISEGERYFYKIFEECQKTLYQTNPKVAFIT